METQPLSKEKIEIEILSEFHISFSERLTQLEHLTADSCRESKLRNLTSDSNTIAHLRIKISLGAVSNYSTRSNRDTTVLGTNKLRGETPLRWERRRIILMLAILAKEGNSIDIVREAPPPPPKKSPVHLNRRCGQ